MNSDPVQVRLSGAGGQGLITAGVILAEAALLDGKNVVQTQTYGPEARLGSSKAEVIISATTIAYPQVTVPDILLCLSLEAAKKYMSLVHHDTLVVLDSTIGPEVTGRGRIVRLPMTATAVATGGKMAANTVALGALNRLTGLVSPESLRRAVLARVPERFRALNAAAIEAGERLASPAEAPA
ncbi:2-oxoglutarate ferredoxin oxidoreductase subunit gamma [Phycisphaerales bacterium]|nr:2-oxoglutarate ferredoxin oxidoreductase subunit gamma [Phycisphaerales bacterium]